MEYVEEKTIRVNYMIFERQDKELRMLQAKNPLRAGLSGHIRIALDNYLKLDPEERVKEVPKAFQDIITLIEFMKMKMPLKKKQQEWDLSKGDLMLMFGREWYKMTSVVEMTVHALNMKKLDAMHEVVTVEVEGARNQTKIERLGFKVMFATPISRNRLCAVRKAIEEDLRCHGRVIPLTNGEVIK